MKNVNVKVIAATFLLVGCAKNSAVIDGQFFGESDKMIYLEKLSPMGGEIVDSTATDEKGKFTFKIKNKLEVPTFFNVNLGNNYVPLLIEDGEDVEISSMANIFYNYTVEGSKGSSLIKEFNMLVRNTTLQMDSLVNLHEMIAGADPAKSEEIGKMYEKAYIDFKRNAIIFIAKNSTSLASLLPLYKPYNAEGQFLFDQPSDYLYFVMLSDSLSSRYPTSEYVISLKNDIDMIQNRQANAMAIDSMINEGKQNTVGFIELVANDAKGKKQKLSDHKGKVILLSFTASEPAELKTLNNELKDIYSKYNKSGLVIYQVFIDANKAQWLNTVSDQKLPWICVNDVNGNSSRAAQQYNITKVPTNILIDRNGDIVSMDLKIDQLETEIAKAI